MFFFDFPMCVFLFFIIFYVDAFLKILDLESTLVSRFRQGRPSATGEIGNAELMFHMVCLSAATKCCVSLFDDVKVYHVFWKL